jgi:AcrR family transcriptional regulator
LLRCQGLGQNRLSNKEGLMARHYRLKRRAKRQDETRQRIVEAAVELHTTLGPRRTSILAIAERAGVERPTVYRHFPTTEALFTACSSHDWAENPPPDPEPWLQIESPEARLRHALGELYAYYSARETALWSILRDLEDTPELRRFGANHVRHHERMLEVLATGWRDHNNPKFRAALGHATDFFAWRSLHRHGLSSDQAADLMVALARSAR